MKLSKKFAGALLLGLTMVTIAAVPASAAQLQVRGNQYPNDPDFPITNLEGGYTAFLYKEVNDDCEPWRVIPRDTLITMEKLKYNAEISHVRVTGISKQKICVLPKRDGQYYLRFKANQYIRPGDRVKISFVVYQREGSQTRSKKAYNVKETITFKKIKAYDVFERLIIGDDDLINGPGRGVWNANFFDDDDYGWDGRTKISVKVWNDDLSFTKKYLRIYAVNSNGKTVRVYSGDRPNLDKVDHLIIRVEFKDPQYFKRNDCVAGDCGKINNKFDFVIYNNN